MGIEWRGLRIRPGQRGQEIFDRVEATVRGHGLQTSDAEWGSSPVTVVAYFPAEEHTSALRCRNSNGRGRGWIASS